MFSQLSEIAAKLAVDYVNDRTEILPDTQIELLINNTERYDGSFDNIRNGKWSEADSKGGRRRLPPTVSICAFKNSLCPSFLASAP